MRIVKLLGLLLWFAVGEASARSPLDPSASLLRADAERRQAMVEVNLPALTAMLAPELSYGHANGVVEDRAALLASLDSGRLKYGGIRPVDINARVFGATGIVVASAHVVVTANGAAHELDLGYTATYLKRAGRWQLVAYRSVPLPPAASSSP